MIGWVGRKLAAGRDIAVGWIRHRIVLIRNKLNTGAPNIDYWREPEDKGLTPAYWDDPRPDLQGMLTAEQIVMYDQQVGGMIRPFERRLLKPASYELTLGPWCMVEGKERLLSERHPHLIVPKNSIVFVSMNQVLCLPHYVVGRFDLAIDLIYQGLLLGTGPQVDPGFQGALGCPLHNISNDDIELRYNAAFAKIDFVKTAPREPAVKRQLHEIKTEDELARWLRDDAGPDIRLFKGGQPTWREPIFGYTHGRRPTSSVQKLTATVARYRTLGIVGIVGVLLSAAVLVFALFQIETTGLASKQDVQHVQDCQVAVNQELARVVNASRSGVSPTFQTPKACP